VVEVLAAAGVFGRAGFDILSKRTFDKDLANESHE